MGVSFKVSRIGKRFQPKPVLSETVEEVDVLADAEVPPEGGRGPGKIESTTSASAAKKIEADATREDEAAAISENEVSFTLNVFPDGYSIGKPSETALQDIPKFLPYDRASESLFSAIESGRLPGDILDDIPCKYVNGTIVCEVRDYRRCTSEAGPTVSSLDGSPIVNKVVLRMSLENIVKDIPLISDSTWTYGDLMEVESRILKALQPRLYLDPTPNLDRLCEDPVPTKLNLDLYSLRKRRRQLQEFSVTNSNTKRVCTDRVPESSNCMLGDAGPLPGNVMPQHVHENLTAQNVSSSHVLQQRSKSFVPVSDVPGASPSGQDMMVSYTDNMNSNIASHNMRENQDGLMSPLLNKRPRLTSAGPDSNQQQLMGPHMDSLHGTDPHWKNPLLQHQSIGRGLQYGNAGVAKYPQQIVEGSLNQEVGATQFTMAQQRMGYTKEEPVDSERLDKQEFNQNRNEMHIAEAERNHMALHQSRPQQRLPQHAFMRSNFSQSPWNGLGQPLENNSRKEDQFPKRKSVQSPRVSAGGLPQSPLSSKSGEFSSGSVGHQFGPVSALGSSQKEKSPGTSLPAVGGTSLTSSANDSMQRQHQTQLPAKRRSNSLPKTPVMSGVGSPASVSNVSVPLNASSPPVGTPPLADPVILDRFSKLERVAVRHNIHFRKSKVNEQPIRKPTTFSSQQLSLLLSSDSNNDNLRDESCTMPLSKSLVGGSMNACKIRVLNFVQTERVLQGNGFPIVPRARTRMIMSMKPNDGTVAMHFGDIDDGEFLAAEEYLSTLPNAHIADLLAAQLCSRMIREGYHVEDRTQPKPTRINHTSSNQSNAPGTSQNGAGVEMQQYSDAISGQPSNEFAKPTNSGSGSLTPAQNLPSTRMLPPGNVQALQNSQGLMPGVSVPARPQQSDPQTLLQPQPQPQPQQQQQQQQTQQALMQQQPSQFQRSSPLMLQTSPLSHMNTLGQNSSLPLGMVNKSAALQIQMLQQQQQQQPQQQQHMQRRMMMGLGTAVGLGNIGNNMMGLRGLGNVMGMGGPRGMGGAAISAPMGPISGMGTVGQNPMNLGQASSTIGQQLRSGTLTQAQAAHALNKFRMGQNRSSLLGGPQSSMGGIAGARQMHPGSTSLSMFDHGLTRGISPLQRTTIGPMPPPKLMTGMNLYMNPQQQQQIQQQLQQQQQIQQQLQQQQPQQQFQQQQHPPQFQQPQQQETASPLQTVVSPQQVGSPSTLGIPQQVNQQSQQLQQQASPQQMSQRTPMSPQMSSGAMHPLSAGNPEACPASPQLSSQTLGSVGSITNSPMELQGVNKSNSVNNA